MFVIRYVALAALVVLMGTTVSVFPFAQYLAGRHHWVVAGCGLLMLISLFVMKFVGPPPQAFPLRAAAAFAMMAGALYAIFEPAQAAGLETANLVIGLLLLGWYARE